ncbi:MAG: hypothetical protein U5L08_07715 [Xanthomonadales bacterium]|nr:hypothetical protein [Xanthomonadales bacterium]
MQVGGAPNADTFLAAQGRIESVRSSAVRVSPRLNARWGANRARVVACPSAQDMLKIGKSRTIISLLPTGSFEPFHDALHRPS